jgi:hypothetical protein
MLFLYYTMITLNSLPVEKQRTILLETIRYQKDFIRSFNDKFHVYDGTHKGFYKALEYIRKTEEIPLYANWMQSVIECGFFFKLGLNYSDQIILRGGDESIFVLNREPMVTSNSVYIDLIDVQKEVEEYEGKSSRWWWMTHAGSFSLGALAYYLYSSRT